MFKISVELLRLTREFVWWRIDTDNNLTNATAEVAFTESTTDWPTEEDWVAAELVNPDHELYGDGQNWWIGILIGEGGDVVLSAGEFSSFDYQSWVRIDDAPERPVRRPGVVTIL